jgi:cytochrome b
VIDTARTLRELSISPRRVRVWDLPTRIFHWLLVLAVALALATGFIAPE